MKLTNIITKAFVGSLICSSLLTSCIDETFPTSQATKDQVGKSPTATEAMVNAIPAYAKAIWWSWDISYSWGLGAMMHIRDVMTEDLATVENEFDWFWPWANCNRLGQDRLSTQFLLQYPYKYILNTNNVIGTIDPKTATDEQKGYLGVAQANRAMMYLDIARMFEFLPNKVTSNINADGNDVTGLTVPIIKPNMSNDSARVNPRATKEKMTAFILEDLKNAEQNIIHLKDTRGQTLPDLSVVYGLEARLYLWMGDYANAEKAARNAINNASVQPMTEKDCLDSKTGFNQANKWMWAVQYTKDDETVKDGWLNWTSWKSNEIKYGYLQNPCKQMIGKSIYDRISDTDFRKLMWKAPDNSPLAAKNVYVDNQFKSILPTYASLKWRPGNGRFDDMIIGESTAYPLMRVEEMYFIEAEAAAHQDMARGKKLVEDFMRKYRDKQYSATASTKDALVEEIVFQKRVELWGEGQTFFDVKRLNYSVKRGYPGTNFYERCRFNTDGRPAWMNIVFVDQEQINNKALVGWNNPDPSNKYTPWVK